MTMSMVHQNMFAVSAYVVVVSVFTDNLLSMALDDRATNLTVNSTNTSSSARKPLYLGGYFTLGGIWDGSGILPAVEMALDHINDRTDVLAEYELRMIWNDTQCESGLGTRMLFDQIFHEPQKILILGPPCSTDAQAVADAAHYWNLISVSYSAASPALSNRQKYRYFYRTNFNALSFNPVRVRLVREFRWERVALIRENREVFALTFEDLSASLDASNITIISSENFDKDPRSQVANLKHHDAKVIFLDMFENMARKVFCERYSISFRKYTYNSGLCLTDAYKLGMTNEGHVWFIPEWYTDYFWTIQDGDITCSVEEMTRLMSTSTFLVLSELFLSQNEQPTVSGMGPVSFKDGDRIGITSVEQLRGKLIFLLIGLKFDESSNKYLWAQSKQFSSWLPEGSSLPLSGRPGDCVYVDFTEAFSRWVAIACDIQIPSICEKDGEFSKHLIASYAAKDDYLDWHEDIRWSGDSIPMDHTPRIVITTIRLHKGISLYSFLGMSVLAGVGILLAVSFIGFNIYYRHQRFVKMSSPNLNNTIILGSILIYFSIIAGGLDSGIVDSTIQLIACQVRAWLLSIGFVLAFGSMFSKTWRVYRVAALKTPKRRIITDNQLYLMVLIFFCLDAFVLTLWQTLDPLFLNIIDLYERDNPEVPNQRLIPYIEQCTSDYITYWLLALYSYKGLLLLFGTFLAWETRKVTFAALNDSKLIGICVYNTIVLCIIGVSVRFIITNDPSTLFIFTSSIVAFCATLTLIVLFLPKIISVYKDPTGESAMSATVQSIHESKDSREDAARDENKKLRKRIIELETILRRQSNREIPLNIAVNDAAEYKGTNHVTGDRSTDNLTDVTDSNRL
ncbi:gamma-aminobutyric acid type B receptor subunit 1-like [Amphiura filiformis]|uniref:gamma-aminobutyric acid type B receptor subunit 1-like n=1 Tax=Amphiura filiformis TaxID=82378 RepID=UPI003B215A03